MKKNLQIDSWQKPLFFALFLLLTKLWVVGSRITVSNNRAEFNKVISIHGNNAAFHDRHIYPSIPSNQAAAPAQPKHPPRLMEPLLSRTRR